jgi:hypothetical protein
MKPHPLALPLLAAGLAGCADTLTTPLAAPANPNAALSAAPFDLKEGLALAVDDARSRVIPTLGSTGAIRGVDHTFAALGEAVRSGDTGAVRDAIGGATGTLNALEHSAPGTSPVEVAALRLVLQNADLLFPAQ